MKKLLISMSATMLIFAACGVNDDEDNTNPSTDNTIGEADIVANDSIEFKTHIDGGTAKIWMASGFTIAGLTTFTECRLDDEFVFNADGTYTYDGGIDLCGAEDNERIKTGIWELDFRNRTILFDKGSSNEEPARVIGLNENEIRVNGSYMTMEVRGIYTASE